MEKRTFRLYSPIQAHKCLTETIWPLVKGWIVSTETPLILTVAPEKRSGDQNARLHATLSDVAKQLEWAGKRRDVDTWKRLMVAAWMRTRTEPLELLPAIDGHGFDIVFAKTSKLTRAQCADLTTYIEAWGSERGVRWSAPDVTGL